MGENNPIGLLYSGRIPSKELALAGGYSWELFVEVVLSIQPFS
jgi:hypothetical protein